MPGVWTRAASGSLTMLAPALTFRRHVCTGRPLGDRSVADRVAGRVTFTRAAIVSRRPSTSRLALATWKASSVCGAVPAETTRSILAPSTANALPPYRSTVPGATLGASSRRTSPTWNPRAAEEDTCALEADTGDCRYGAERDGRRAGVAGGIELHEGECAGVVGREGTELRLELRRVEHPVRLAVDVQLDASELAAVVGAGDPAQREPVVRDHTGLVAGRRRGLDVAEQREVREVARDDVDAAGIAVEAVRLPGGKRRR